MQLVARYVTEFRHLCQIQDSDCFFVPLRLCSRAPLQIKKQEHTKHITVSFPEMQTPLSTELCWTKRFICQVAPWTPVTLGIYVWWAPCGRRQYFQADDVKWWPGIWSVKIRRKPVLWFYCCCLVAKSCPILCNPLGCSMPGFPDLHYLLEFAQTHVHWVSNAI